MANYLQLVQNVGIVKCNGTTTQRPVNRAFWIICCQVLQLSLYEDTQGFISITKVHH
jgi:hypothetical protein